MTLKKSSRPEAVEENVRKLMAGGLPKKRAAEIAEDVRKAAEKKAVRKGK